MSQMSQKQNKPISDDDYVLVMNNTMGGLTLVSPSSKRKWRANNYGKTLRMKIQDIIEIASDSTVFENGYAVILDENVIEHMNLTEQYKYIIKLADIEKIMSMSDKKIREILSNIPKTLTTDIVKYIRKKIQDGDKKFDSTSKIRLFEDILGQKIA